MGLFFPGISGPPGPFPRARPRLPSRLATLSPRSLPEGRSRSGEAAPRAVLHKATLAIAAAELAADPGQHRVHCLRQVVNLRCLPARGEAVRRGGSGA